VSAHESAGCYQRGELFDLLLPEVRAFLAFALFTFGFFFLLPADFFFVVAMMSKPPKDWKCNGHRHDGGWTILARPPMRVSLTRPAGKLTCLGEFGTTRVPMAGRLWRGAESMRANLLYAIR
jgi:hypothetical protein